MTAQPKPLADDWLYWDPATIHAYPEDADSCEDPDTDAEDPIPEPREPGSMSAPRVPGRLLVLELVRYVGIAIAVGIVVAVSLSLLVVLMAGPAAAAAHPLETARAQEAGTEALATTRIGEVTRGSLLFKADHADLYRHAPVLATDVSMQVTGPIARVVVCQRFRNPGEDWVEGVYVFPLPESAAVDHLRMQVGQRVIEGQVKERQEAKRIYRKARESGRKAVLVEQERPNIFTNSVANIGPGEEVSVEIEYQQTLRYDTGTFQLRFPMVVAPRYIPGAPVTRQQSVAAFDGRGWATATTEVPDAARITPPVMDPRKGKINPVTLSINLDAGFALSRLESPYHAIEIQRHEQGQATVRLAQGPVPADRDFVLVWAPRAGETPKAALFTETLEKDAYALLMVMPPDAPGQARLPRDAVFIIDTSGSMGGTSIRQARQALAIAVERLAPGDRFNIIQFNDRAEKLFDSARPANPGNIRAARKYVRSLQAGGGTNMAPALRLALDGKTGAARVRQVVFLTDGAVGNEAALFSLIEDRLGDSRLFTVGIGSAPNAHFMSRAARFGHGSFTYIGSVEEVAEKMKELFAKLERPAMTHLSVAWPEAMGVVEAWPARLPDLYHGEPVVVVARMDRIEGEVSVTGQRGQEHWQSRVKLKGGLQQAGIGVLWARRKIADLMDASRRNGDPKGLRQRIVDVALRHHLVSKHTSLVAVDVTQSRPVDAPLESGAVATNLPHGWQYEKVFGRLPQGATPAPLHLAAGSLLIGLALAAYLRQRATA